MAAAQSLNRLPAELIFKIHDLLDPVDQVHFCSTTRLLRETAIYQWHLFRTISVAVRDEIASTSALLAARRYGCLVRELRLIVGPPSCRDSFCRCREVEEGEEDDEISSEWETDEDDYDTMLPDSALALIRAGNADGGLLFPHLEEMIIQFPDSDAFGSDHASVYFDDEDLGELKDLALDNDDMADVVLTTLADPAYPKPLIKALSILHLPPVHSYAFGSKGLDSILSRVQTFELSVFGEVDKPTRCWSSNGQVDYLNYFNDFPSGIFDRLSSVKSLKFHGSPHAPLGFKGTPDEGLGAALPDALTSQLSRMPFLEELELSNIVVGPELEALFKDYSRVRRRKPLSLRLINVCAEASSEYTWARLFKLLVERPVVVNRFEMSIRGGSIEPVMHEGDVVSAMAKVSADAQALLDSNAANRAFSYAVSDDRIFVDCHFTNAEGVTKGEDQAAYNTFMETVKAAAAASP
ncbi:hypothetical protein MAPG_01834 [Magnaporthiopsis poae ATCC 64411]|uniref:F-box domain-containing protein n=1 Tax=Magnaporthiopsis poae (strain ATCC 64411 / 73-15) TaxID=644358 RepID=A0A0C4DPR2_MAGP6|nr:hypothetical protein MAPG_01834 [Magnaporthiopsis poae ATCC 64411]